MPDGAASYPNLVNPRTGPRWSSVGADLHFGPDAPDTPCCAPWWQPARPPPRLNQVVRGAYSPPTAGRRGLTTPKPRTDACAQEGRDGTFLGRSASEVRHTELLRQPISGNATHTRGTTDLATVRRPLFPLARPVYVVIVIT